MNNFTCLIARHNTNTSTNGTIFCDVYVYILYILRFYELFLGVLYAHTENET